MKITSSLIALLTLGLSQSALAAYHQAPPSFSYKNAQAVFIDLESAEYDITYDLTEKTTTVETTITFNSKDDGHPIFDLVAEPTEVILDGELVTTEAIKDPDQQTTLRIVKEEINSGFHEMKLKHTITTNVVYTDAGVASGFWMSDLNDRRYLEQYLPSNLEFDQYKMSMKVNVLGAEGKPHLLKANGKVSKLAENSFEVVYPDFYSASSVYFHLFLENNSANNAQFYYLSIDGRLIPVDIYTIYDVETFVTATKTILTELEADYGAFPHDQLIIYGNAPSGGMEHSGATITSLKALGHELFHSYHARGLMPANGNAGWMDEAIARWRDNNYPLTAKLTFDSTRLAGRSIWSRMTDRMAYTEGSAFLSWIAFRMNERGLSFKKFLRDYFQEFKFTTVTTQLFQSEITEKSGLDLKADFDQYIYGKTQSTMKFSPPESHEENPYHPKLSKQQLLDLTWL